jgi:hypothetical protein
MFVYGPGLFDTHALLRDERITLVGSPLLVEWRNIPVLAVRDDVANPCGSSWRAPPPLSPQGRVSATAGARVPVHRK